jgi:hypothetical protein
MYTYDTVTEAVEGLRQRGYNLDFNLKENCLICHDDRIDLNDFEIVEVYRFEGNSDPGDEAIVYAIESKNGHRGILVGGYGISSDTLTGDMARKLSIHNHNTA